MPIPRKKDGERTGTAGSRMNMSLPAMQTISGLCSAWSGWTLNSSANKEYFDGI